MDWRTLFFTFEGRINRLSFWVGTILLVIVNVVVLSLFDAVLGDDVSFVVSIVVAIALLYPSLAVHVKRWHDRDKSGWWVLVGFIPIVGLIWVIIACGIRTGTPGDNRFGPKPADGLVS